MVETESSRGPRFKRLTPMLGRENALDDVARYIKHDVQDLRPASVGAIHLTCSDESEHECADSFQDVFVTPMLPRLKFAQKAAFRIANLGGRYEFGAVAIAESHFATPESERGFKALVVKVNSHVSKDEQSRYGEMQRYQATSYYCGALRALLEGRPATYTEQIAEVFASEGLDRLKIIRESIEPEFKALAAAIVNARLQARAALLEIQDHAPATPTLYLVVPCVTLNTADRDTELVVGYYVADLRGGAIVEYDGLGDDPSKYRIEHDSRGRLSVSDDDEFGRMRRARDHREMIGRVWRETKPPAPEAIKHARLKLNEHPEVKPLLKLAVLGLASAAGVPTALFLFGEGLVGLHHIWRAQRLARGHGTEADAHKILSDFEHTLEGLPPERSRAVLEKLLGEYPP